MTAAPELLPALEQTLEQLLQSLIEMGICACSPQGWADRQAQATCRSPPSRTTPAAQRTASRQG